MLLENLEVKEVQVFKSWQNALPVIKSDSIDFMIIDLFLAQNESGFDHIELLNELRIPFLFCTGYPKSKFLNKALSIGAKGFFTKPLDKAAITFSLKNLINDIKNPKDIKETLIVKDSRKLKKIFQRDILYVKVEGNYITIQMKNDRKMVIKNSLKAFEKKLTLDIFLRCHRSTLLNVLEVKQIDMKTNQILLQNNELLPLGDLYSSDIRNRFNGNG